MNSNQESADLLKRFERGDDLAAKKIFERYSARLTALARSRLSERMARRVDPEDIIQSAFRSFFRRAGDGNYSVREPGDLWRLLATITVNKLRHQRDRHLAEKRSIQREDSVGGDVSRMAKEPRQFDSDPTEQDVVDLLEELEEVLKTLEPRQREIVALQLDGWAISETADQVDRTERTVRRVLARTRDMLQQRLKKT